MCSICYQCYRGEVRREECQLKKDAVKNQLCEELDSYYDDYNGDDEKKQMSEELESYYNDYNGDDEYDTRSQSHSEQNYRQAPATANEKNPVRDLSISEHKAALKELEVHEAEKERRQVKYEQSYHAEIVFGVPYPEYLAAFQELEVHEAEKERQQAEYETNDQQTKSDQVL
ncbi:Uu.00g081700.m01.CDS01 [Anthostomella pinea]|uniref:Uu.00g081700.m01.CDS01 n=1 Tax=Anthostomella pinea TaxID=933095 RepID=A0AAI8VL77_9PEZI|nr:Uu.00g081700.m01.CDS01 [Anthostomella pinea]